LHNSCSQGVVSGPEFFSPEPCIFFPDGILTIGKNKAVEKIDDKQNAQFLAPCSCFLPFLFPFLFPLLLPLLDAVLHGRAICRRIELKREVELRG
jgi:hypothetical protein